jgi:histone acetyltransferase (RNA polymerase elongator complex component)
MTPKRHVIPVFVPHLGCPNACVFCNQRLISGSLEPATPGMVTSLLEIIPHIPDEAPKQIAFYGGSFTAIPVCEQDALLEAAQPFISKYRNASLRISTRPDRIDQETLFRLKRRGVATIELGAQSMDDGVLHASGRGHTARDTVIASRLIRQNGIELILQMMTGLPEDTPEKSTLTAQKLIELQPDGVRIYPTVVIRSTMLHELWKSGAYKEHTVEDAVSLCAALYELFDRARIPVIRLGLNPTEDLTGSDAICGAYHPALGELILSRVYLNRARTLLNASFKRQERGRIRSVALGVHPGRVSVMTGQKRGNLAALQAEFGIERISVVSSNAESGEIVIMSIENAP